MKATPNQLSELYYNSTALKAYTEIQHLEKIRSGQSFLYREDGLQSMVVELRMKDPISGSLLKKAFDIAILRYPYLTYKMIEKDGNFYYAENLLPFIISETKELHSIGSKEINYHLIDLTYYKTSIFIAFHHAISDGRGLFPFIKTMLYYYCTSKYNEALEVPELRRAGEPLLEGETAEPFEDINRKIEKMDELPAVASDGYILPETLRSVNENTYYRYEIHISSEPFMKLAKENNATPAILTALLISKALYKIHPKTEKPIKCTMVSDIRKGIQNKNTYKDCSTTISLPYKEDFHKLTLNQQATKYREVIKEQKNADNLQKEADKLKFLSDTLDALDSFEAKKDMLSKFNHLITDTFILSYVGQVNFGDCEKYVQSLHAYGSGTNGLTIELFSIGDLFIIDFMQSFETNKYMNAFAQVMKESGLKFSISDIIRFETPKDSVRLNSHYNRE